MELYTLFLIGGGVIAATAVTATIMRNNNKTDNFVQPDDCEKERNATKPLDKRPASVAFAENLDKFIPLLPGIEKGEINSEAWKEAIINTNNEQLILYWKNVVGNKDLAKKWLKVFLEPCGVNSDNCESFVASPIYVERYTLENGHPLVVGNHYNVITPCWLYSSFDDDETERVTVLHKGIVRLSSI